MKINTSAKIILIAVLFAGMAVYLNNEAVYDNSVVVFPTSPPPISENNNDLLSTTTNRVSFQYPARLPTKFIQTVDWPPQLQIFHQPFICQEAGSATNRAGVTERHIVNGRTYCITKETEGAAGTIYTHYMYIFSKNQNEIIFTFVLKAPQCANYEDPEKTLCQNEAQTFNLDQIIDDMAQSLR